MHKQTIQLESKLISIENSNTLLEAGDSVETVIRKHSSPALSLRSLQEVYDHSYAVGSRSRSSKWVRYKGGIRVSLLPSQLHDHRLAVSNLHIVLSSWWESEPGLFDADDASNEFFKIHDNSRKVVLLGRGVDFDIDYIGYTSFIVLSTELLETPGHSSSNWGSCWAIAFWAWFDLVWLASQAILIPHFFASSHCS